MATTEYGPGSPERVRRWAGQAFVRAARRLPLPKVGRRGHADLVKSARSGKPKRREG